jgi:hypothetical protein
VLRMDVYAFQAAGDPARTDSPASKLSKTTMHPA